MLKSIRLRIALAYLLLIVAVMVVTGLFLLNMLEKYYISSEEDNLERTGKLAAELIAPYMGERADPILLSSLAESFSRQIKARVVVLSPEQVVLGDSVRIGGLVGTRLDRNEVAAAMAGNTGRSIQYSLLSEQWVLQMALPLKDEEGDSLRGTVFLSTSLNTVFHTIAAVKRFLVISTLTAMALAGALAILLAHHLTGPIKKLTFAAEQMANGQLDQRIPVNSRDEIGLLARQFNIMATRVKEMNQRLTRFVGDVSHELRTPLASILVCLQSLQNYKMKPEEQKEFLEDINQETQRLIYLVEDLLEITRGQEVSEKKEIVAAKDFLEEVLEVVRPRMERKGLRLFTEIPTSLPYLYVSKGALKRVLHNLLDNAIKFTPSGGWLKLKVYHDQSVLTFILQDTGCGIPEEELPHIFERFYRVDKARSRFLGGTGLGLAICKEIVELNGGEISVKSQEGEGSSFFFTLPYDPSLQPAASEGRKVAAPATTLLLTLLLSLFLLPACSPPGEQPQEAPIEPLVAGQENPEASLVIKGRFSVVNPEMRIFALNTSRDGRKILFSSEARSLQMLDDQGRLLWEAFFEGLPAAAAMASDGYYAAVGTDQGKIVFLEEGAFAWQEETGGQVELLELAGDGSRLAAGVKEEDAYFLYLFNSHGELLTKRQTEPLEKVYLLPEDKFGYLEKLENGKRLSLYQEGEFCWEAMTGLAALSSCYRYAVLSDGENFSCYYLAGEKDPSLLWSRAQKNEFSWLAITEKGTIIAYNAFTGSGHNLFLFNNDGKLIWEKRVPRGSQIKYSRLGERIVVSSWQEYSDDFSKVLIFDEEGRTLQEVDLASRIEKIALSADGAILVLAGSGGDIFILGLPGDYQVEQNGAGREKPGEETKEQASPIYKPVYFRERSLEKEEMFPLYFFDEHSFALVPVHRTVNYSAQPYQAVIEELIKGPHRLSGLSRTLAKDLQVSVTMEEGLITIYLPQELELVAGSDHYQGKLQSLFYTAYQLPEVENVRLVKNGTDIPFPGTDEEKNTGGAVTPWRQEKNVPLIYLPYRSGERYYLLPREGRELPAKTESAAFFLNTFLQESAHFWPKLRAARPEIQVQRDEIILDWPPSLQELFPANGTGEEKALAALFMDALLLTLAENLLPDRIICLVEGQFWEPPEGYPALTQKLSRPYFLNPE